MHAIQTFLARPEVERLGWMLLHFVWQGALIAALSGLAFVAFRRASAHLRYLIACSALVAMAACLPATWILGGQASSALGERVEAKTSTAVAMVEQTTAARAGASLWSSPGHPEPARQLAAEPLATDGSQHAPPVTGIVAPGTTWRERVGVSLPWLVIAWLTGVFGLSVRLAVGWSVVHRLRRGASRPADASWQVILLQLCDRLRIGSSVNLMESALVEVPTMIGWLRPVVLWPPALLSGLSVEQFEALLAHELAHVRRHDYLVNLLQTAIETLLFYHPAVWWLSRRIRHERECCCDDLAVSACGNRLSYARALANLEEHRSPARQLALAADGGRLLTRIRRILGLPAPRRRTVRPWLLGLTLSATLLTLAIAIGLANLATGDELAKSSGNSSASNTADDSKQVAPAAETEANKNVASVLIVERGGVPDVRYFDEDLADRIKAIPHVKAVVTEGLMMGWSFREEKLDMIGVSGRPPEYTDEDRTLKLGRWLKAGDHKTVVVSSSVAKALRKSIGDKIQIFERYFEVVGIFDCNAPLASNLIEIPLSDMQDLSLAPGKVNGFLVGTDIPKDGSSEQKARFEELSNRICALDEAIRVAPWPDRLRTPRVFSGRQPATRSVMQENAAIDSKPLDFQMSRVIDDQTGKRITNYRVQWGTVQPNKNADAVTWGPSDFLPEHGRFRMRLDWDSGQRARIVASGYIPQRISIPPRSGLMIIENVVRMKRGGQVTGRVVDYAGNSVAGASVFIVGPLAQMSIGGGKAVTMNEMRDWIEDNSISPVTTDAEGRFTVTGIGGDAKYLAISCQTLDLWIVPAPASESLGEFEIRLPQAGKLVVRFDIPGGGDQARFVVRPFVQQPLHGDGRGQAWRYDYMARWNDNQAGVDYGLKRTVKPVSESTLDNLPPGDYVIERIKELAAVYGVVTTARLERTIVKIVSGQSATVDFAWHKGTSVSGHLVGLDRPEMRKVTPTRVFVTVAKASESGGSQTPRDNAQNSLVDAIDAGTIFQNGDAPDGKFTTDRLAPGQYRITANLYDDSQDDLTTLDNSPLFAGEALVTVADDGQPPPVKIELHKTEQPAKPSPPPPKPAAGATVPKGGRSANAGHTMVSQSADAKFDLVVQKVNNLDSLLPEDIAGRIGKIPHVTAVAPGLTDVVGFEEHKLPMVFVFGWPANSPLLQELKINSGRRIDNRDRGMGMVGAGLAEKLKVKVGDKIKAPSFDVPIVGIFESSDRFVNDGIVTRLADLQEFMDAPHRITGVLVRTDIPKDDSPDHKDQMAEIRKQIEALEKDIAALSASETPKPIEKAKPSEKVQPDQKKGDAAAKQQESADEATTAQNTGPVVPTFESARTDRGSGHSASPSSTFVEVHGQVFDDATNKPLTRFSFQVGQKASKLIDLGDSTITPINVEWDRRATGGVQSGDGRFIARFLWADSERLRIFAPGYVPEPIVFDPQEANPQRGKDVVIRMKRGRTVSGRVLDYRGNPMAGASLFVVGDVPGAITISAGKAWNGDTVDRIEDHSVRRFTTDENGSFTVDGVCDAAPLIAVSCPALDLHVVRVDLQGPREDMDIHLPQPGRLTVTYRIAGATDNADFEIIPSSALDRETQTPLNPPRFGASTRFRRGARLKHGDVWVIENLPPGQYEIMRIPMLPKTPIFAVLDRQDVKIVPGGAASINFVRDKGSPISGHVSGMSSYVDPGPTTGFLSIAVGKPGEGNGWFDQRFAWISLPLTGQDGKPTDGRFTTERLLPGVYRVNVQLLRDQHGDLSFDNDNPPAGTAVVTVPEQGAPDPVEIRLHEGEQRSKQSPPPATSPDSPPSKEPTEKPEAQLAASAPGDGEVEIPAVTGRVEPLYSTEPNPAPPKAIEVSGRVVDDATGMPIPHFYLQTGRLGQGAGAANEIVWPGMFAVESSDADGRFTAKLNWEAGERTRVVAKGYNSKLILREAPKAGTSKIQGVVVRLKRGRKVSGRVLDYLGKPVAGASLFVTGDTPEAVFITGGKAMGIDTDAYMRDPSIFRLVEDKTVPRFVTNSDGTFTVDGVSDVARTIAVSCSAIDLQHVPAPRASPSPNDFEIRLLQPGKLVLRYDIRGGPNDGHFVMQPGALHANDDAPPWLYLQAKVKQGGEMMFDNVPPGEYQLVRTKPSGVLGIPPLQLDRRDVKIVSGRTATVDVVRDKGASVSGQVVGLANDATAKVKAAAVMITVRKPGEPNEGLFARLFDEVVVPMHLPIDAASDVRFATERLLPGQYRIEAQLWVSPNRANFLLAPILLGETIVTVPEQGAPEPVKIELAKPGQTTRATLLNEISENPWSKPVDGLQARLNFERGKEINGTPIMATYLELRNVSDSATPLEVPLDPSKIEFKVTDVAGKEVAQAGLPYDGAMATPGTLRLPHDSQLRLSVSGNGAGISKDQGGLLDLVSSAVWLFKRGDVGAYYLRAKIAIPKTDERLWYGTIEIPDTRIPLQTKL